MRLQQVGRWLPHYYWLAVLALATFCLTLLIYREAWGHDEYTKWRQPGTGMSCCSEKDCFPLEDNEAKFENGRWLAFHKESGKWLTVPPDRIINEPNPTGKAHLCAAPSGLVWCFLKPDGGT